MNSLAVIGAQTVWLLEEIGRVSGLLWETLKATAAKPFDLRSVVKQMEQIGVHSIPVVLITATFTGMVLALQSFNGFKRFNAEGMVGTVVALSMTRELGPVLTGLIVAGRAGAAMAAELGTMKVTEQIDALITMAVSPVKYLIVPRLLAGLVMLPLLTVLADMIGVVGGYFVAVNVLGASPAVYIRRTTSYLKINDLFIGLFKAAIFGMVIALISCYKGFTTTGGAEGVGKATTGAVVISMMLILILDYLLTAILF